MERSLIDTLQNTMTSTSTVEDPINTEDISASKSPLPLPLPPELILEIFSHLSQNIRASILPIVSRSWQIFLYNNPWYNITIYSCSSFLIQLDKPRFANIQCLNARGSGLTDLNLGKMFLENELGVHMVELDLTICHGVTDRGVKIIAAKCKGLKKLLLAGCKTISNVDALGDLCDLAELTLAYCEKVIDNSIKGIISSEKLCASLRKFDINGCFHISNRGIEMVANRLHGLTFLSIDGQGLDDAPVISVIQNLRQLKTFSVSFCTSLSDSILDTIANDPPPYLANLRLRKGFQFSREGMHRFFLALSHKKHLLSRLDLSECSKLDDYSLTLNNAFEFPQLTYLNLEWCWEITTTGLAAILKSAPVYLETILVTGLIELTLVGLELLIVPRLRFLKLFNCRGVDNKAIQDLTRRNENLFVIDYYGDVWEGGFKVGVLESSNEIWSRELDSTFMKERLSVIGEIGKEEDVKGLLGRIPDFFDGL